MREILIHLKKLDWILIIAVILLAGIGLLSIYSSSLGKGDFFNFKKQVAFLGIGFFLMIALSFLDWRFLKENPYLILVLFFLCLAALLGLFFFAPEIRGVRSWYKIGLFSIDPIEITKIVFIILLAKYFSMRHTEMYQIKHILLSGFYLFLPAVLIFFQPDLGSVLILIAIWLGILFISGIRVSHFLFLCLVFILIFILSWQFLFKDYQKDRIISFIRPQIETKGIGWSRTQAKIAIGNGGLMGTGLGKGSQTQYGFLPEPQTDFIFAAIAEEMGAIGIAGVLALFSLIIWQILKISFHSRTNFSKLFTCGLSINLIAQAIAHIGMNLGILPVIGVPLPFVSYGGSSLIINFIGLGILESIKANQ